MNCCHWTYKRFKGKIIQAFVYLSVAQGLSRWFDSPGLHIKVSSGKILNPETAPDVLVGNFLIASVVQGYRNIFVTAF